MTTKDKDVIYHIRLWPTCKNDGFLKLICEYCGGKGYIKIDKHKISKGKTK